MARLVVAATRVTYAMRWWERALSLHGDLVLPRSAVVGVTAVPVAWAEVRGVRAPGYGLPRHRLLGTWRHDGVKDFVDVAYGRPGVVVELADTEFARLVLSVPDPSATVAQLSPVR